MTSTLKRVDVLFARARVFRTGIPPVVHTIRRMRSTVRRVFWGVEFFCCILSRSCVSSTMSTQPQKRAVDAAAPLTPSRVQARTKQPRPSAPAASADVDGGLSTSTSAPPPPPPKPKTYSCLCGNNALSSSGKDLTCIRVQATLREVNPNDPRLGYVRLPEGKQGESLHRRHL